MAAITFEDLWEIEFKSAMQHMREQHGLFLQRQHDYYRKHGEFPPKSELDIFKDTHIMCMTKSGSLMWCNPETKQCYKTYSQDGNYEPFMPLQTSGAIFERDASSFDF